MSYFNPADFVWGDVANGEATGFYKDLIEEKYDIATGGLLLYYQRNKVLVKNMSMLGMATYKLFFLGRSSYPWYFYTRITCCCESKGQTYLV